MIQALESRMLFSAILADGELRVLGTSSADRIVVGVQSSSIVINVNGHRQSFSRSEVESITIRGGARADRIDASASPLAVEIHGGSGADTLLGGTAADHLLGDNGNDYLDGGAGRDHLDGGAADDSLFGSAGDDELNGGDGRDHLDGGSGNDKLNVGWSQDDPGLRLPETLLGGAGNDTLNGLNGYGGDEIDGGSGRDFAYFESTRGFGAQINGHSDMLFSVERSSGSTL